MASSNSFQKKVMKFASKVQNNYIISTITQGLMSCMGILMAGAVINILVNLPIPGWSTLLGNIGLLDPLNQIVQLLNCVAIFMSFGIAKVAAEKKGNANPVEAGVIGIICFLIITQITYVEETKYINMDALGSQAVITAMIVGVSAGYLYHKLSLTKLKIKMPASVPPFVAASFENIPALVISTLPFIIIRIVFGLTPFGSFTTFINTVLQIPLVSVGNTLVGHCIILVVCSLLWWLGMHGTMVVMPALYVIAMAPLYENIEAITQGLQAPNALSFMTIMMVIQAVGGPGCLFGLFVDMAFFTKSERYKAQGKLQVIPGMFNIIEPAVYGLPIVLNFTLLLPMLILPVVIQILMYVGIKIGIMGTPIALANGFIPGPILGFLAGGGLGFGIFIVLACILSCVVYYPFVKIMDAQQLKIESGQETE